MIIKALEDGVIHLADFALAAASECAKKYICHSSEAKYRLNELAKEKYKEFGFDSPFDIEEKTDIECQDILIQQSLKEICQDIVYLKGADSHIKAIRDELFKYIVIMKLNYFPLNNDRPNYVSRPVIINVSNISDNLKSRLTQKKFQSDCTTNLLLLNSNNNELSENIRQYWYHLDTIFYKITKELRETKYLFGWTRTLLSKTTAPVVIGLTTNTECNSPFYLNVEKELCNQLQLGDDIHDIFDNDEIRPTKQEIKKFLSELHKIDHFTIHENLQKRWDAMGVDSALIKNDNINWAIYSVLRFSSVWGADTFTSIPIHLGPDANNTIAVLTLCTNGLLSGAAIDQFRSLMMGMLLPIVSHNDTLISFNEEKKELQKQEYDERLKIEQIYGHDLANGLYEALELIPSTNELISNNSDIESYIKIMQVRFRLLKGVLENMFGRPYLLRQAIDEKRKQLLWSTRIPNKDDGYYLNCLFKMLCASILYSRCDVNKRHSKKIKIDYEFIQEQDQPEHTLIMSDTLQIDDIYSDLSRIEKDFSTKGRAPFPLHPEHKGKIEYQGQLSLLQWGQRELVRNAINYIKGILEIGGLISDDNAIIKVKLEIKNSEKSFIFSVRNFTKESAISSKIKSIIESINNFEMKEVLEKNFFTATIIFKI